MDNNSLLLVFVKEYASGNRAAQAKGQLQATELREPRDILGQKCCLSQRVAQTKRFGLNK